MSFTMFEEPKTKMQRVAKHLVSTLEELCAQKWTKFVTVAGDNEISPTHFNFTDDMMDLDMNKIKEMHRFSRPKDHFSWNLSPLNPFVDSELAFNDAQSEYYHYANLLRIAKLIYENSNSPQFGKITELVKQIKDSKYRTNNDLDVHKVDYTTGGNIAVDLVTGIAGVIHAIAMMIVGVIYALPYYLEKSDYCGSPLFFADAATYLVESTLKAIGSLIPPLGMLYSKYTTDSFNTLTKGKVERALDSLDTLVKLELGQIAKEREEISDMIGNHY